jgi:hypothetical protein
MTAAMDIYRRDEFRAHTAAVEQLRAAGIEAPQPWTALRNRFGAFVELGRPAADMLSREVISPSGTADILMLRCAAVLEELDIAEAEARVTAQVTSAVLGQLRSAYSSAALRNYKAAAARYDSAARRLSEAADLIDVECDGDALVSATQGQRDAWLAAPDAAVDCEAALAVLCAAASLAGAAPDVAFVGPAADIPTMEVQIALCADPGKAHRRKTWAGWLHAGGRTGRWGKLHALDVTLRAAKDPASVAPYAKPPALLSVIDRENRVTKWDPCDGKPPQGFRVALDGWAGAEDEFSASVV